MAALLAAVAGRIIEQLVGVPHMSDKMLHWMILGMMVSLPAIQQSRNNETVMAPDTDDVDAHTIMLNGRTTLKISLAFVLAAIVVVFTLVKNPSFALAEIRASAAEKSLGEGRLDEAIRQADSAISLAPGVGRYHITRGRILDEARGAASEPIDRVRLAQEAFLANQRAVNTNPFDIYSRLYFAESTLTLAGMGQTAAGEKAVEEYQRLTLMLPRYWLSHFLLARTYVEIGNPESSIQPFGEAIRLNPEFLTLYDYRATAYETLGEYELSLNDYAKIIELNPTHSAYTQMAIALYALGRLEETVTAFQDTITLLQDRVEGATSDEEVVLFNAYLSLAHNNRGSVLQEVGRIEKALDDYTEAIHLNPQLGEAFYNRATAFAVLGKIIEAKQDLDQAETLGFARPN